MQQSPYQPDSRCFGGAVEKDVQTDEGKSSKCLVEHGKRFVSYWFGYEKGAGVEEVSVGNEDGVGSCVERGISKWNDVCRIFDPGLRILVGEWVVSRNL